MTAALSPDGSLAVTGTGDKRLHELILWDVATMQELRVFPQKASVRQAMFSPDGQLVAAACFDRTVKLLDTTSGRIVAVLRGHVDGVNGVSFSGDGSLLASIDLKGIVKVWDVAERSELRSWKVGSRRPYTVGLSPDGTRLLSAGRGNTIEVWDIATTTVLHLLEGHHEAVETAIFSPNGSVIASCSWDSTVRLWDAETGELLNTLLGHAAKVQRVAFSPDGTKLISGSVDNTARIWRVDDPTIVETVPAHLERLLDVGFSLDGKRFITGSFDTTAKVWDTETKLEVAVLRRRPLAEALQVSATVTAHRGDTTFVEFTADGRTMVTGGADQVARVWDMDTGKLRHTLARHNDAVTSGSLSPDGLQLATVGQDGTIHLWNVETGAWICRIGEQKHSATHLAFLPDGHFISTGRDGRVRIHDVATGELTVEFSGPKGPVTCLAVSPDGSLIATTSSKASTVTLWELNSGQQFADIPNFTHAEFFDIKFSPDGSTLAIAATDGYLSLWDLAARRERASVQQLSTAISFTRRGFQLAAVRSDGRVFRFDAGTLVKSNPHALGTAVEGIHDLRLLPDGQTLGTISTGGEVTLWSTASRASPTALRVKEKWSAFRLP